MLLLLFACLTKEQLRICTHPSENALSGPMLTVHSFVVKPVELLLT
jgi:hypothetical protein